VCASVAYGQFSVGRRFLFCANERALLFNLLDRRKKWSNEREEIPVFISRPGPKSAALLKIASAAYLVFLLFVCLPAPYTIVVLLSEKNGKLKRMSNSRDLNRRFLQLACIEIST
jgi:hypothetical protein